MDVGPGEEEGTEIGVNVGEGVLTQAIGNLVNAKKESQLFTDDPEEAVLFADEADIEAGDAKVDEAEEADAGEKKDDSDAYFL